MLESIFIKKSKISFELPQITIIVERKTSIDNNMRLRATFSTIPPNTYVNLIEAVTRNQCLKQGKTIHAHIITTGLTQSTHLTTKLMTFYAGCNHLCNVRKLFDQIPQSNPRRWIIVIGAYSRHGFYQEALILFNQMIKSGLRPNVFVIPSVFKACGHVFDLGTGKALHCVVLKYDLEFDVFVTSALVDMYCKCGKVEMARRVFDRMVVKNLVALNALVSGYAQCGLVEEGFGLVEEMRKLGVETNVVTWNTLIAGFAEKGDEVMVSRLFELMVGNGLEPDVVSWTSVISGLVHNFRNNDALETFRKMLRHGCYPSQATISSLLPACASVSNVRRGTQMHGYAVVIGLEDDIYVRSALVDMYAKCGFISEARILFSKMSTRNTPTWNSMIFGYANHGYCDEAIELFNQMEKVEPRKLDHLTFIAVLTSCSHAGMVERAQSLFTLMQEKYKIVPRLEHYACMVDILGRASLLTEAYNMIKAMPIKPDLFVWGALLGACRNHGNIDLAEIASKHLKELEPKNAANSKLLSNLYADAGSWDNVARFKKMMKRKKFTKIPGHSWIEAV